MLSANKSRISTNWPDWMQWTNELEMGSVAGDKINPGCEGVVDDMAGSDWV